MVDIGGDQAADACDWRKRALVAADVLGMWEWDLERDTARYCTGTAELLAGDAALAWRDLLPADALSRMHADDAAALRVAMRRGAPSGDAWARDCRLRLERDATRRVLCRGRTYPGPTGAPACARGVIIDLADDEAGAIDRGDTAGHAALDRAAEHGLAAYREIETSGIGSLFAPARALLIALGRELAARTERPPGLMH